MVVPKEKMTWIRLGQEVLLEKVIASTLLCAQLGLLGALAVAILPFVSEVLQLRSSQKRRRRDPSAMITQPAKDERTTDALLPV